ncbi:uncharacterized protein UTRI_00983_B [Ustilago trichophora]|uniref:Secreted protein n=1 Tax=Ustilago trichophora TaxID=86804 RepID=A0A5C3DWD8_9BASI|nr:uncharacterized protein UTRI_00983_B [Ustilago trichophora]
MRSGHLLLLLTALVATCLLQNVEAGQIRPARRAIVADRFSPSSSSGGAKLNRRWFFGFSSALKPKDSRESAPVIVSNDRVQPHPSARETEHQHRVEKWNHEHPKEVHVKLVHMSDRGGSGRGTGGQ